MTTTPPARRRPAFLDRLQPLDFRSIAAQGCFVYAYLRSACGTPYYIGIARRWQRPLEPHKGSALPADPCRIRIMRTNLTWQEACKWEQFYIARWGRKDNLTGILRNRTDGGEGGLGQIFTPQHRAKISAARKGSPLSPEHRAKLQAARKAWIITPETRAKMSAAQTGKTRSPETRTKMSVAKQGTTHTAETRAKLKAANTGKTHTAEHRAKITAANTGRACSLETRAKISASVKASITPELRAKQIAAIKASMTPEVRAKISAARKNRAASAEARANMSNAHKGKKRKPLTPEHRAKISAALKAKRQSA